jgi:NADPH-dependent 2,4-dienoyl-CoA reductase/sulfur reductase-like enzyme
VILGAGPAGINAIETIRALDADAAITLVCDEPAYARMVLPYYLAETIEEGTLFTGDAAWLEAQQVEARIGRRATGLDPAAKRVSLDAGSSLDYDALLYRASTARAWWTCGPWPTPTPCAPRRVATWWWWAPASSA